MIEILYSIVNTVFFIGYIKGGGTIVSFLFFLLLFFFKNVNFFIIYYLFVFILFLSYVSISNSKKFSGDDRKIVVDELLGALISVMFLPKNFFVMFFSILIFRYLDISKIFFLDKFENIEGPTGIILDDIMAGIIANLITQLIILVI
ncbi:MAG: phosphatidylglycerophosphatase A [candidate division WOR-3 bacterium]